MHRGERKTWIELNGILVTVPEGRGPVENPDIDWRINFKRNSEE
jgi:hypothetical protein